MNTDEGRAFNNDDERADDLDYQDFLGSFEAETEPIPSLPGLRKPLASRRSASKSKPADASSLLEEYKGIHLELHELITLICDDQGLNAERKADLIRFACKRSGVTVDNSKVVQLLLDHHHQQKYGTDLLVISSDSTNDWFDTDESHLIDSLLISNDLNIIGGLSGASKTTVTAMMVAALLQKKRTFLGFKVNHHICEKVFFIGLDGGKNVYRPIFEKAGLLTETGPIENFHFIPNESGWSMSSSNLDKLEDLLKDTKNSIVIVDSLLAATTSTGVDENSAQMAARILDLKLVCERHGATPIVLAHQKKEATQDLTGSDSLRGHSSIPCFAGGILTLNFLDQKSKVNGKSIPDRNSPKRRLVAGHRGTPVDLLVEIDFDKGDIKTHGDFYDALFAAESAMDLDDVSNNATIRSYIKDWAGSKKTVLDVLRGADTPITQAQLMDEADIAKGTVSKMLKSLTTESYCGNTFVEFFEGPEGKTLYNLNHLIKKQLNDDY